MLSPSPPVPGAAPLLAAPPWAPQFPPIPLWGRRAAGQSCQPCCLTLDFGDEGPCGRQGLQGVEQWVLADDLAQDTQGLTQALVGQRPLGLLGICEREGLRCCILVPRPCPVCPCPAPLPCVPPSHVPGRSCHLPDHAANPPGLGGFPGLARSHPACPAPPHSHGASCPACCWPEGSLTFEAFFPP